MNIENWQEPKEKDKYYIIDGPIKIKTDNDDIDPLLGKLYAEYVQQTLNAFCPRIEIKYIYDLESKKFKLKENEQIKIVVIFYPSIENNSSTYYIVQWYYENNLILYTTEPDKDVAINNFNKQFLEYLAELFASMDDNLGRQQQEIKEYLSEILIIRKN